MGCEGMSAVRFWGKASLIFNMNKWNTEHLFFSTGNIHSFRDIWNCSTHCVIIGQLEKGYDECTEEGRER